VRQLIVHLLAVIAQQAGRLAAHNARVSQHSRHADRPPSSGPPDATRTARSGTLERELGALWTFVVEEGVEPTNNRAE
jgi:hypothetical protein